jgi:hypothetical protein
MRVPGFSAEESLYLARRTYSHARNPRRTNTMSVSVLPAYSCWGAMCGCFGDDDCNSMFQFAECGDIAACYEEVGGCACLRI